MPATSRVRTLEPLWRYGRAHWRSLAHGLAATVGFALFRLAIPWPLRGIVEFAFPTGRQHETVLSRLPSWVEPVVWLCGAYLVCAVGVSLCEMAQRLGMGQFVSRTVTDLRAEALRTCARRFQGVGSAAGELIARLVADAARLRSYLSGILLHVSKDALLFLAVVTLFLIWISPAMGVFFLVGGGLACSVGYIASRPLEVAARRARHHEGLWAVTVQQALEQGHLAGSSDSSRRAAEDNSEAQSTRILGTASVVAHALLALTVCLAIWTGVAQVRADTLAPGELFLFIAYALMIHRRLVDAGRQLARIGKLRACVERLATLLDIGHNALGSSRPLHTCVRLEGLCVQALRGGRPRLDGIDLELRAGSRVAVVGRPGDGKSTLLRCLAGLEPAAQGKLWWDGVELGAMDPDLCASVAYLPEEPVFARTPIWKLLGLSGPAALDPAQVEVLRRVGAWQVVERLSKGLRQKVSSATLSRNEARALCLGAALLSDAPMLVLDSPVDGLAKRAAAERLATVLETAAGRTLVVALPRPRDARAFERVVVLRRGRIPFDGSPGERRAWKAARLEQEVALCRA